MQWGLKQAKIRSKRDRRGGTITKLKFFYLSITRIKTEVHSKTAVAERRGKECRQPQHPLVNQSYLLTSDSGIPAVQPEVRPRREGAGG